MANLLNLDASHLLAFLLVVIRVGAIFAATPVLGSRSTPARVKTAVVFVLALIVYPFVPEFSVPVGNVNQYLSLVLGEVLIGISLGLVGRFMFGAVHLAGELTGYQMGLSIAGVVDPSTGQQQSVIAVFENALATLLFLAMDLHHYAIQAMVYSYEVLTPGQVDLGPSAAKGILRLSADMFVIGFQLGAPLIVALFLTNLILGLAARSVPQMNIFVVGFPLSIFLGLLFIYLGMPFFMSAMQAMFERYDDQLFNTLKTLAQ